jgi:hypothetical protein
VLDVTKNKHDNTITLYHYEVDVFNVAVDQQQVGSLLKLSSDITFGSLYFFGSEREIG